MRILKGPPIYDITMEDKYGGMGGGEGGTVSLVKLNEFRQCR